MSKMIRTVLAVTVAATSLMLASGAQAEKAAEPPQTTKIGSFLCKDIVRMSGDDRIIALSLLNGYYLGKKGATEYVPSALGMASDNFIEYCLDHPGEQALGSFGKFLK